MNNKKKSLVLSILLILGLIVVTVGVTYAFFNYTKEGSTENTLTTGTITFLYTEVTGVGKGISIDDAFPISDEQGKAQTGEGKVFDFKITSDTFDKTSIPYEVTARKKKDSTLDEVAVKLYLTKGETEEEVLLDNFSNLTQTSKVSETDYVEKTIYKDKVPANTKDYEETFRLRMWIDEEIDFSGVEQEDGTIEYPYNDKTFTITVNVYANAEMVNVPEGPTTMTSATSLSIGDAVTATDGSKWHVLEASAAGTETVTLLSDYNLNTDGTYNTDCQGIVGDYDSHLCSVMVFDPNNTSSYDETDSNNIGYFIKNTYNPLVTSALPGTTNVTIPTAYQIALADGKEFDNTQSQFYLTATWLSTTSYWTKTYYNGYFVWLVDTDLGGEFAYMGFTNSINDGAAGARPVITTPKTNLLAE